MLMHRLGKTGWWSLDSEIQVDNFIYHAQDLNFVLCNGMVENY